MAVLGLLATQACIPEDERCGDNQKFVVGSGIQPDTCVCVDGTIPHERGYGCVSCGVNEVVMNGKCVCQPGFIEGATGACEMAMIGVACTSDAMCSSLFPYCVTDGAEQYCTARYCTATSCPVGYACEQSGGVAHCEKLPKGLGKQCTSDADCADGEVKTCDTRGSRTCTLIGCANKAVTCPGYYACCDLSPIPASFCVAPTSLTAEGQCMLGKLVTP